MSPSINFLAADDWNIQRLPPQPRRAAVERRRRGGAPANIIDAVMNDRRFVLEGEFLASPSARATPGEVPAELSLEVELADSETAVVAVRHPSGAISLHPPEALRHVRCGWRGTGRRS